MRSNENMNWMRNHIAKVANQNKGNQRRLQEVRNQRAFASKDVYTVADLMEDVSQMNQQQFDEFIDTIGLHECTRVFGIFDQAQKLIEGMIEQRNLLESAGEFDLEMLIEAQQDRIKKMIIDLQNRLKRVPADSPEAKQLKKQIDTAENQIKRLQAAEKQGKDFAAAKKASTGVSDSGKPKFKTPEDAKSYIDSIEGLKNEREKVRVGKERSEKIQKFIPRRLPSEAKPEAKPEANKPTDGSNFASDYGKYRDLLSRPSGEALGHIAGGIVRRGKGFVAGFKKAYKERSQLNPEEPKSPAPTRPMMWGGRAFF